MRNNYGCDLDSLTTGSRIGMMRSASGDLHYYINGVDQGVACTGLPPGKGEWNQFTHPIHPPLRPSGPIRTYVRAFPTPSHLYLACAERHLPSEDAVSPVNPSSLSLPLFQRCMLLLICMASVSRCPSPVPLGHWTTACVPATSQKRAFPSTLQVLRGCVRVYCALVRSCMCLHPSVPKCSAFEISA